MHINLPTYIYIYTIVDHVYKHNTHIHVLKMCTMHEELLVQSPKRSLCIDQLIGM